MDTPPLTAPEVAAALGVSLPTAHHALDDAGIPRTGRGRPRLASSEVVDQLIADRGAVPRSGRTSSEVRVLTALSRSPLGQKSARDVAAKAGISPTTASRVLAQLERERLIERRDTIVASGRARHELRWFAASEPLPAALQATVRRTRLPERAVVSRQLPNELRHLFWNADSSTLDQAANASYIAERLLRSPDVRGWQWSLVNLPRADIETALSRRGTDERTRAIAHNWWAHER